MKQSLRSWLWRVRVAQEVDEELALHVELRTRELVERGLDPKVARDIVLSRIGDSGNSNARVSTLAESEIARCASRSGSTNARLM